MDLFLEITREKEREGERERESEREREIRQGWDRDVWVHKTASVGARVFCSFVDGSFR